MMLFGLVLVLRHELSTLRHGATGRRFFLARSRVSGWCHCFLSTGLFKPFERLLAGTITSKKSAQERQEFFCVRGSRVTSHTMGTTAQRTLTYSVKYTSPLLVVKFPNNNNYL